MSDDPQAVSIPARRRRQRLSAETVRELMIKAAADIVREQGVMISLEEIAMDDVVRRAGVPRSSAYRIWPYKGDFVTDLLLEFAGPNWMGTAAFDEETLRTAARVLLADWTLLKTAKGRRALTLEAVRRAVERNLIAIESRADWLVYTALVATARGTGDDETRQQLAAELERAERQFVDTMADFYGEMTKILGIRPRPGVTLRHIAAAGAAVVEGLAMRRNILHANKDNPRRVHGTWSLAEVVETPLSGPGVDGQEAPWQLAATAFMGILDALTEPDPSWKYSDDARALCEALAAEPD